MAFASSAPRFFSRFGAAQSEPITNTLEPARLAFTNNAIKAPNLFDTIQAVRQNELDRQIKQATLSKVLQELMQAPIEQKYREAQIQQMLDNSDQDSLENQIKLADLQNKINQTNINEQSAMARSGFAPTSNKNLTRDELLQIDPRQRRAILGARDGYAEPGTITGSVSKMRFSPKKKSLEMSPIRLNAKDKRTEEIITSFNVDNDLKSRIYRAEGVLNQLPGGLVGSGEIQVKRLLDKGAMTLSQWQGIKSLLTDATLNYVKDTKGSISDREMELFLQAAANDKIYNPSRIGVVLSDLRNRVIAKEKGRLDSYKKIYGEDPREWAELANVSQETNYSSSGVPSVGDKFNGETVTKVTKVK